MPYLDIGTLSKLKEARSLKNKKNNNFLNIYGHFIKINNIVIKSLKVD